MRSNDGKRRIDVLFRKIGMELAAATGIPGAIGDVLVCEIYTKRVAGEFDEAPKEAETSASGRSRSGWRASTTPRSAIPASSRHKLCSPPFAAGSCRSASGR